MITVISTCHQRFERYELVLQAWLSAPEVDEVIVVDNSGSFKTDLPVTVMSMSKNMGVQARYPIALFAKNDKVIFADDDILVKPEIVKDFLKHYQPDRAVGMIGRIFDGTSYYTSTGIRGENTDEPVKVDWLGAGCTLVGRDKCGVFIGDCPDMTLDDWWWERCNPDMKLFVVPTKNYEFMEEGFKIDPIYKRESTKKLREEYYKKWQN